MGFATGFKTGYDAVSDTIREYERQKLREGLRKLGPEATAVSGQGFEVIGPEGKSQGLITPQPGVDLEAIKQAYASGGYTFRPTEGPAFAARAGGRDIGMYETEAAARGASEPYNIGLTRQAAGLYEQANLDAEARQMRGQARQAETDMTRLGMENERLGLAKDENKRAGKLAEARLKSEELSQQQAGLQIKEGERLAKERENMDLFTNYMTANPNATRADLKDAAKSFNLTVDQQFNVVSRMTGMAEDDLKAFQADVKNTIKGKNLGELLDIHKNDKRFDDKTYFNQRKGPKGEVILDLVDQESGKVIRTESFKDANLATAYLNKAALEPDTLAEWMLGIRGAEGKIRAQDASTAKDYAAAQYYGAGGGRGLGGGKFTFAGMDKDGTPISYDTKTGKMSREDGGPIQDPNFVKKFTGEQEKTVQSGWDEINKELLKAGQPPKYISNAKAQYFAERGYAPESAISVLRSGKNPDTGKPWTQADIDAFRQTYPNTDISKYLPSEQPAGKGLAKSTDKTENKSAAPDTPTEDTKKYIRSKNPRGGYKYEESSRGLTKKQYAEIDAKKQGVTMPYNWNKAAGLVLDEESGPFDWGSLTDPSRKRRQESPGFFRSAADIGVKVLAGVPQAAAGITGLGTMIPGVRELAEPATAGLTSASQAIEESLLSNYQLRKQRELGQRMQEEEGFLDQAGAAARYLYENPRQIVTTAAASLPSMLAGGLVGRGLQLGARGVGMAMSPAAAAAAGEGTIIAGGVAGDIAAQNPELADRFYAIPAGVGGALASRLSGRLLGKSDIDTMISARLARGEATPEGAIASSLARGEATNILSPTRLAREEAITPAGTMTGRVTRGVIGEGLLEEAPQSAMERMATNVGTGRPLTENLGGDVVMGAAAGGFMGAGAGIRRPGGTYTPEEARQSLRIMADRESPVETKAVAANFIRGIEIGRLGQEEADRRFNDYIDDLRREKQTLDAAPQDLLAGGLQQVETRRGGLGIAESTEGQPIGRTISRLVPTEISGVLWNPATGTYELEQQPEAPQRVLTQRPVENIPGMMVNEAGIYSMPGQDTGLTVPSGGTSTTVPLSAPAAPGAFSSDPKPPSPDGVTIMDGDKTYTLGELKANELAADKKKAKVSKKKAVVAPIAPAAEIEEELDLDIEEDQKRVTAAIGVANKTTGKNPLEASVQGPKGVKAPGVVSLAQRQLQGIRDALFRKSGKVAKAYGRNEQRVVDAVKAFANAYDAYQNTATNMVSNMKAKRQAKAEELVEQLNRQADEVRTALGVLGNVVGGNAKDVEAIVRLVKDTVQAKKAKPGKTQAATLKTITTLDTNLSRAWAASKRETFMGETADLADVSGQETRQATEQQEKGNVVSQLEKFAIEGYKSPKGGEDKYFGLAGALQYLTFNATTPMGQTLAAALRENVFTSESKVKLEFVNEGKSRYDPKTDTVYIRRGEQSPEVVLHEALHAAMQWFVYKFPNDPAVRSLQNSLTQVLGAKGMTGKALEVQNILKDLVKKKRGLDAALELVSYTATLNEFRKAIQELPSTGDYKSFTNAALKIWTSIKSIVQKLLGVKQTLANDILAASMDLLERGSTAKYAKERPAQLTGKTLDIATTAFSRWFGNSKVVDKDGQPLVVYHGTANSFAEFSSKLLGGATGAPSAKLGFFFAGSPITANKYARNAEKGNRRTKTETEIRLDIEKESIEFHVKRIAEEKARQTDEAYRNFRDKMKENYGVDDSKTARQSYDEMIQRHIDYHEESISEKQAKVKELENLVEEENGIAAKGEKTGANIIPVFLSIKNPMVIDQKKSPYRIMSYYETLRKAKAAGHDGVIIKNTFDGMPQPGWITSLIAKVRKLDTPSDTIYIAFESNQIKSVFNQAPTEAPGILEAAVVSNEAESPMPSQVSNVDFRAFANSQESWRLPTQVAGELLGFGKNGATTNYIKKRGTELAAKIRKDYPTVETFILNFNSKFSNGVLTNDLINNFKFDQNTGYMQAEKIAEYLSAHPEIAKPFMDYMDGSKNALNKVDDNGKLKSQADYLMQMHEKYINSLPETSSERAFFEGKKFSEYLIVPRKVSQAAGTTFGVKTLASMLGIKPIVERNIDFFKPWLNEVDGVLETDNLYQVMERVDGELVHAGFMAKDKFDKNGTPTGFTVNTDMIWRMSQLNDGAYRFTSRMTAAQALANKDVNKFTTALLNTTAALAHTYSSRNFLKGMATVGYENGKATSESVAFESVKEINSIFTGRKIVDDDVIEASDEVIKSPRIRTLLQRTGTWVKLPDTSTYGDMAGKYMPGPVWNSMVDMHDRSPLINSRIFNETMAWFKEAKTVLNPGTHVTNFLTNITLSYLHNIPTTTTARAARLFALYEIAPKRLTKEEMKLMQAFNASGSMLGEYTSAEVKKTIYDALEKAIKPDSDSSVLTKLNTFAAYEKTKAGLQKLRDKSKEVYAAEDNIFRLAAFLNTAGNIQFRDKTSTISEEQMKEAGKAAKDMFLDYDIDARAVRAARQSVLPFVSWTYAIMPVLGRIAVDKPWTIANVMIAYMLAQAALGGGEDDDEELRKAGPKYIRDKALGVGPYMFLRLPFMGDDENPVYFNLGKYVPFFTVFQPPPGEAKLAGQSWIPGFLTPSGPMVSLISAMTGYDPFTGKPLHKPTDDEWDKLTNFGKAVYDTVAPPALNSKFLKDLNNLSEGKTTITGREPDTLFLARKLGGLSLYEFNVDESMIKQQKAAESIKRDFSTAMKKAKQEEYRKGYPDYEALDKELETLRERMDKRIAEVRGEEE